MAHVSATYTKLRRLFNRGCADYGLLADGDRVLIALSGGKDSMVLTQLLGERARLHKPQIEVEAVHVVMDNIPYASDLDYLQDYCSECGVRLTVLHTSFDASTDTRRTHCFLCAWNRRKTLFEYASANGFNKVALGHHQDDILASLLMSMTFEGAFATMPPILPMEHYPLSIIRPMCIVPQALIQSYAIEAGVQPQKARCPYETETRRTSMENILRQLEAMNPEARYSLWNAMTNIKAEQLPRVVKKASQDVACGGAEC